MNLYLKYEHSPLKKKNLVSTGVKMALPVAWWQVLCTDRVERLQYLKIGRGKLLACLWKWNDEIYIPRAKQQMDQTGANERVGSQGESDWWLQSLWASPCWKEAHKSRSNEVKKI